MKRTSSGPHVAFGSFPVTPRRRELEVLPCQGRFGPSALARQQPCENQTSTMRYWHCHTFSVELAQGTWIQARHGPQTILTRGTPANDCRSETAVKLMSGVCTLLDELISNAAERSSLLSPRLRTTDKLSSTGTSMTNCRALRQRVSFATRLDHKYIQIQFIQLPQSSRRSRTPCNQNAYYAFRIFNLVDIFIRGDVRPPTVLRPFPEHVIAIVTFARRFASHPGAPGRRQGARGRSACRGMEGGRFGSERKPRLRGTTTEGPIASCA